jgi:DNA replication and repair protein RecF
LKTNPDDRWLDALDTQIADTAVAVAAARIAYAGELNYFLENGAVSISGQLESWIMHDGAGMAAEKYRNYLTENRVLTGDKMVLDGAHKSDFLVLNRTLNLPAHLTSTGQQKLLLIDIILGHAKLIHAKIGKTPIVLLDEAAAHLDASARAKMFADLADARACVWVAGLERDVFADVPDAAFVSCHGGEIFNIV